MPDTGERREIKRFVNAKETETVQHAKTIVSKTKQQSRQTAQDDQTRKERKATPPRSPAKTGNAEELRQDKAASERMVDEGDPNPKP